METMDSMDRAKWYIDRYFAREFEVEKADYTDLKRVYLAADETEDGQHELEVYLNLVDYQLDSVLDGELVERLQYESLDEMIDRLLPWMGWSDLCISNFWDEEENKPIKKE